ncbi:MAG: hypothetical protein QOD51_1848 [Candidatus Eremiobacteraeota bacterium]|nr:hypothetical protein [Candidatus Eremiobacteraeota bacterium]
MWLFFFCALIAPAAAAEPERLTVRVTVVESLSRRPVARAHVRLVSDARKYDGFTAGDGTLQFTAVVRGTYGVRVDADGYTFSRDAEVSATGPAAQSLTVTGVRTKLSRIGTVASRIQPAPNLAQSTQESSAQAVIAGSVAGALGTIPAAGRTADGSLLIHNHDASTTAATINGAPIFPSGTKNQLGLLGSDIFSSASVGSGIAGAPNGTLDAQTYDPTIDSVGLIQERAGSFGSSALTVRERGTAGRVGLSFVHAQEETGHPLDGRYFADTSGSAYTHHANPVSSGDTFTTRYGFDANHVAFLDVGTVQTVTPLICTVQTGPLRCGYGAGDSRTVLRAGYAQLRDVLTLDRATLEVHAYQSRTETLELFRDRTSGGGDAGYENSATTDRRGYSAKLGVLYAGSRIAHVSVSSYGDVTHSGGSFVSSSFLPPVASSVTSFALDVPVIASRRFTFSTGAGRDTSAGTGHTTFNANTSHQLTNRDGLTASFSAGRLGTRLPAFSGLGAAGDLTFDCSTGMALGDGPFLASGSVPSSTQTRVGLQHSGARISMNVQAYRDVDRGATVSATVPATALSGSLLSVNYLAAAAQAGAANCGRPVAVTAANLFYRVSGPADRIVTDGFDSSAQFDIGRAVRLQAAYSLSRARAFGTGLPFVRGSDVVAGSQLPARPLHRGSAQLTYALSSSTTLLGTANYYGSNNTFRTQPFTTVDLGARFASFSGDLTVAVQNAADAAGGPFAGFDPFPALATPARPRTYSVRYRFALGKQGIDKTTLLSPPFSAQGGFSFMPVDFESTVRADWLAPDTQSPLCGAEQLSQAKRYADALRSYDRRVQEALRADPRLKQFPAELFEAVEFSFVRNATASAVRIRLQPGQGRKIGPFTRCTRIHVGSYDDAARLHLYSPTWQEREAQGFGFFYSPQAGVYFAPEALEETVPEHTFRTGLPARAPADPFAIDQTTCPATYRPAVQDALRSLKNYITAEYAGGHPTAPDGFTIARHAAKAEPWLEVRADDRTFGEAIVTCVNAPNINPPDLRARGLSGANFPSFNYAPSIGFYRATIVFEHK